MLGTQRCRLRIDTYSGKSVLDQAVDTSRIEQDVGPRTMLVFAFQQLILSGAVTGLAVLLQMMSIWCPGAESNHRHCDFQATSLPDNSNTYALWRCLTPQKHEPFSLLRSPIA